MVAGPRIELMRNRGSNKRAQGKALDNQIQAWKLVVTQGLPYHEAAEQLCVSTKAIQRYINRTLESAGSSFPTDLAPAEINKLRQLQSEILLSAMAKVIRQMDAVEKAAGIDVDAKLMASSAGLRALAMANGRLAAMNALNAPTKIIEESLRLEFKKVDGRVRVEFDREQLRPTGEPIGLVDCDGEPYERPYDPHQIE
jgi:transposase